MTDRVITDNHSTKQYEDRDDREKQSFDDDGLVVSEKAGMNVVVLGGLDAHSHYGAVQRRLKPRHISMIAIGGTIGTGLFLGSGEALSKGGPVGLLLGYTVMGAVVYSMMIALGEMATLFPVPGSFMHYATRWLDPAFGFALGYNYWYTGLISIPAEVTAASIVISYWDTTTTPAAWITLLLAVVLATNFCGVRWYGEAEFWFAIIKVTTIVGLIILGLVLDLGGGPNHERIGFAHWKNPGALNQLNGIAGPKGRFLAFWATFVNAAFSFLGTEVVALTAAEAENPRRNVPKAIRRVFFRILLFYIGGVIVIGWLVPYNDPDLLGGTGTAASSPFVIAIKNANIKALPSLVNAAILTSALSAGNSDLYSSSRTLYGLACSGQAPRFLRKCTKAGLPIWCVAMSALGCPLTYLNVSHSGSIVFEWFVNITSITGLITWDIILITYARFYAGLKYNGIDRNKFAYKAPFQPYATYFGIFFISVVILFNGFQAFLKGEWNINMFITAYISLPIFASFYTVWKVVKRPVFVRVEDMDFETGCRELDLVSDEEAKKYVPPTTFRGKFWAWLF